MAKISKRPQLVSVARAGAVEGPGRAREVRRGTRAEALDKIFETAEEDNEGFRHGVLGRPRFGKTYHLKEVVEEANARGLCDLTLIHDCKRLEVQYDGLVRVDLSDLAANPLTEEDEPVIVLHGDPALGVKCRVEEVAAFGLAQGRAGTATVVLIDELYHGMKARQTWDGKSFPEILREGSSQRVSSAWTTQMPQALPTEALDLTESVAVFQLRGRGLRYLVDMYELPDEAAEIIKNLERGEFVLLTDDDFDFVVYGPK